MATETLENILTGAPIVGGLLGGISGYFGQKESNKRAREAARATEALKGKVENQYGQLISKWDPYTQGLETDYAKYQQALKDYEEGRKQYSPTEEWQFDLNKKIDELWDPYYQQKIGLATANVYGGAANAGKLLSSAAARNTAQAVAEQYDKSYADALKAAQEQERQEYQWYSDQIARERAAIDQANQLLMNNIMNYGGAVDKGMTAQSAVTQLGGQKISDSANLELSAINARAGQVNPWVAGAAGMASGLTGQDTAFKSVQNKG